MLLLFVPKTLVCLNLLLILQTLTEVDGKGDGKIDEEVWKAYAARNSSLLKHITQTSNHICHCLNDSRVSMVT